MSASQVPSFCIRAVTWMRQKPGRSVDSAHELTTADRRRVVGLQRTALNNHSLQLFFKINSVSNTDSICLKPSSFVARIQVRFVD